MASDGESTSTASEESTVSPLSAVTGGLDVELRVRSPTTEARLQHSNSEPTPIEAAELGRARQASAPAMPDRPSLVESLTALTSRIDDYFLKADIHDDAARTEPKERHWDLHQTLSFWAAISITLGSVFFIVGGIKEYLDTRQESDDGGAVDSVALIAVPYECGSIVYAISCYSGYVEVLNEHVLPGHRIRLVGVQWKSISWWLTTSYLIGSLL